jgi:hypothetical protein
VDHKIETKPADRKVEWIRPELQRLEAGAAESNFSGASDGSGQQGIGS